MQQNAESVWEKCLNFVEDNIDPQAFKTWFKPIVPVKLKDNALNIEVPSKFFYEWIEEHYIKILKTSLHKELGDDARLVYIIRMENTYGSKLPFTQKIPSSGRKGIDNQSIEAPSQGETSGLKNPFIIPGIRNLKIESQLNANYNFDNFLKSIIQIIINQNIIIFIKMFYFLKCFRHSKIYFFNTITISFT